jgi:hypothetical protein
MAFSSVDDWEITQEEKVRMVAKGRRGPLVRRRIRRFEKAWQDACRLAGCPGRIPHDFRRTAIRNMVRRRDLQKAAQQLSGQTGTKKGQSRDTFASATGERS